MKIAIYSRVFKDKDKPFIQELFDCLAQREVQLYIFSPYYQDIAKEINIQQNIHQFNSYESFKELEVDYLFSLGGDGTILNALTIVRDTEVPIMGINLGRLGFLAMIEKHKLEKALDALERKDYILDSRTLLYLESSSSIFGELNFALNDFTILKRDTSSMVTIHTYVNGEFLNSYWADGIIVATPTGSTGYSLSCGGPIISPKSGNFIITPVAPHNLNVRPIVLSDDVVISFEVEGRAPSFLCTLDSRSLPINTSHQLAVRRAPFKANLVRLLDTNFLYMIREKLKWGIDSRN